MKRKIIAAALIAAILFCCVGIAGKHFAYIVHYNNGNRYYRQYSYGRAIEQYEKALEQVIPEGKECRIRINLALAMLGLLGPDYAQPEQIENSIMVLEEARWELLAQDCATDAGTGHSEEAEQLKEEIDKMLKQLYQQQEGSGGEDPSDSEEQGKEEPEELDAKEQSVREEISKMQEKAYQEREAERQFMQEIDLETVFDYEGDIW